MMMKIAGIMTITVLKVVLFLQQASFQWGQQISVFWLSIIQSLFLFFWMSSLINKVTVVWSSLSNLVSLVGKWQWGEWLGESLFGGWQGARGWSQRCVWKVIYIFFIYLLILFFSARQSYIALLAWIYVNVYVSFWSTSQDLVTWEYVFAIMTLENKVTRFERCCDFPNILTKNHLSLKASSEKLWLKQSALGLEILKIQPDGSFNSYFFYFR